jgi:hypothetical protein
VVAEFRERLQAIFRRTRKNESRVIAGWLKIIISHGHESGAYPEEATNGNNRDQLMIRRHNEVVDLADRIFVRVYDITFDDLSSAQASSHLLHIDGCDRLGCALSCRQLRGRSRYKCGQCDRGDKFVHDPLP